MSSVEQAAPGVAEWYAAEVLPVAAKLPVVGRSWLIESVDFPEQHGPGLPQLIAVYESVDVASLPEAYHPDPAEWEASAGVSGARGSARQVLADFWFASPRGTWWCSVRADCAETDLARANWERFEHWYTFEHVGETVTAEGFHEGWRLGHELLSTAPSKHHRHQRWAMYELTKPEDIMIHVRKAPLKAIWNDTIDHSTFGRTYHRVVATV
ncbi:MAG: hypothetical protein LBO75_02865 [Bifidobacteriaceae bacterium]|jgi:hypothetical protein|nr:hypothetical protein [Bifidobacteriaceae bacterium]